MPVTKVFDVIVCGGGVAGSTVAGILSDAGYRVLLLEASDFRRPRRGEFLLARGAAMIDGLAVLSEGWRRAHGHVHEFISTWGGIYSERNSMFEPGGDAIVLNRGAFDLSLVLSAVSKGSDVRCLARLHGVIRSDSAWTVVYHERHGIQRSSRCKYLILCCGRVGPRISPLPFGRHRIDRLVCFGLSMPKYSGDLSPSVESFGSGWVYTIGLPQGGLMVNLFTESNRSSPRSVRKSPEWFLEQVLQCPIASSRILVADAESRDQVDFFSVDASSAIRRPATGPGWCLAGDFAQSMDPLSSSGISAAIEHAGRIARELGERGPDSRAVLETYGTALDADYDRYLKERFEVYGKERRFSSPFWSERHVPVARP